MHLFNTSSFLLLILLLSGSSCASQYTDTTLSREVKNLTAFSKIYGYIKYFHPSDEAREVDWDRLAVLGVKKVKEAKTKDELTKALESLFLPIAPTLTLSETEPAGNEFLSTYLEQIGDDTTGLKTVAWQHLGVDLNGESQIYSSGRINREDETLASRNNHINLYQNVLAQDLPGANIRLRAMIKTTFKSQESEGVLMLRLDDANSRPLQVVTKTVRPPTSDSWTAYTVKAEPDSSVSQIKTGVISKKGGKLWIADIQLEAKDQKGNWRPVPLQNAGFEHQEKSRPVGWEVRSTDNYDYGVVPDEAVDGNSFYMSSKISADFLFQRYPQVGETAVRPLAAGLWSEVPLALYSDEDHTLPRSSRPGFNRLKKELEMIDLTGTTGHDKNVRLADIVVAWNIFQHFYPYFDVIDTNWESQLSLSLKKALGDDTQQEFNATLSSMLASTRDGHIRLRHPSIPEAGLPFLVDWIENRVVVTHSMYEQIQPGDIVTSIDGKPATSIVQDQRKQIPGSPQLSLFRSLRQLGAGESGTEVTVEIQRKEGLKSYSVQRSSRQSNSIIEKTICRLPARSRTTSIMLIWTGRQ